MKNFTQFFKCFFVLATLLLGSMNVWGADRYAQLNLKLSSACTNMGLVAVGTAHNDYSSKTEFSTSATSGALKGSVAWGSFGFHIMAYAKANLGYEFLGWSEDANATTATYAYNSYQVTISSSNSTSPGEVKTLYAVFKAKDNSLDNANDFAWTTNELAQGDYYLFNPAWGRFLCASSDEVKMTKRMSEATMFTFSSNSNPSISYNYNGVDYYLSESSGNFVKNNTSSSTWYVNDEIKYGFYKDNRSSSSTSARYMRGSANGAVNFPKRDNPDDNTDNGIDYWSTCWYLVSQAEFVSVQPYYFKATSAGNVSAMTAGCNAQVSFDKSAWGSEMIAEATDPTAPNKDVTSISKKVYLAYTEVEGWLFDHWECNGKTIYYDAENGYSIMSGSHNQNAPAEYNFTAVFSNKKTPVITLAGADNEGNLSLLVDDNALFSFTNTDNPQFAIEEGLGVVALEGNALVAKNAGTAKVKYTQNETTTILGKEFIFTITVSKHDLVFSKSESLQTAYLVNDAALSLAELWTNNGTGGTTTYEITSFEAAEGEQTGATAPAIANNVLTLGEAGVLVLKASFTGSAKYKDGEDTHTITISRRTNGVLNVNAAIVVNTWNQGINLSDYISKENTDGELVVGVSSDSEVATYDAETKQFALGTKTGTASFSVSIPQTYLYEAVAAKTFTITANQSFYAYAESVISAAGQNMQEFNHSVYLTELAATTNKLGAEVVLANLRSAAKGYIAESVFSRTNVSFLMNNTGFDYEEWNYGWNNGAFGRDVENENVQAAHTVGGNAGSTTLPESAITQTLTLPAGRYTLSAQILVCQVGNANMFVKKVDTSENIASKNLTSTKEYRNLAGKGSYVVLDFEIFEETTVMLGVWHQSTSGITWEGKAVRVDNFALQYVGKNYQPLSLVAENTQGYWATFSSDYDVEFSENVTVYTVTVSGETMHLLEVEDRQVPANTGVLIKSANTEISYVAVAPVAALEDNMLQPGTGDWTTGDNCRFYRLAYYDYTNKTGLGFYYGSGCEDGEAFKCKAGTAYLAVPRTVAAPARFLLGRQDVSTEIENIIIDNTSTSSSLADGKKVMMNGVLYILRDGKTYDSFGRMVK